MIPWLLDFFSLNTLTRWAMAIIPGRLKDGLRLLLMRTQGYKTLWCVILLLGTIARDMVSQASNAETAQQFFDVVIQVLSASVTVPSGTQESLWYALALFMADKLKTMLISDGYLRGGKWVPLSKAR